MVSWESTPSKNVVPWEWSRRANMDPTSPRRFSCRCGTVAGFVSSIERFDAPNGWWKTNATVCPIRSGVDRRCSTWMKQKTCKFYLCQRCKQVIMIENTCVHCCDPCRHCRALAYASATVRLRRECMRSDLPGIWRGRDAPLALTSTRPSGTCLPRGHLSLRGSPAQQYARCTVIT